MFAASSLSKTLLLRTATKVRFLSSTIRTGSVKWFDSAKGFGFIIPDGETGEPDIFVHHSAIHAEGFRTLGDGEQVEYTTVVDDRGRVRADRVTGPLGSFVQGQPRRSYQENQYQSSGFGDMAGSGIADSMENDPFASSDSSNNWNTATDEADDLGDDAATTEHDESKDEGTPTYP